jgi:hypothetical protein
MSLVQETLSRKADYSLLSKIQEPRAKLPASTTRKRLQHLRENVRCTLDRATRAKHGTHLSQA